MKLQLSRIRLSQIRLSRISLRLKLQLSNLNSPHLLSLNSPHVLSLNSLHWQSLSILRQLSRQNPLLYLLLRKLFSSLIQN